MSSGRNTEHLEYAPAPIVLVVEDDPFTRKMVGRRLHAEGYEVILVPDAADALIVAQRTAFHVMVLDLNLMDPNPFNGIYTGFAVLDWLRRQLGDFRFKIVIYTSQTDLPVLERAEASGAFAYCIKRRDMGNLVRCVNEAMEALAAEQKDGNQPAA
jgi:CheY-like chemotaxis protein